VLNKTDTLAPAARDDLARALPQLAMISAETGDGVETLLASIGALLPESPFLYPSDEISTQTLRFFAPN